MSPRVPASVMLTTVLFPVCGFSGAALGRQHHSLFYPDQRLRGAVLLRFDILRVD